VPSERNPAYASPGFLGAVLRLRSAAGLPGKGPTVSMRSDGRGALSSGLGIDSVAFGFVIRDVWSGNTVPPSDDRHRVRD
jgi:hypothetical protein